MWFIGDTLMFVGLLFLQQVLTALSSHAHYAISLKGYCDEGWGASQQQYRLDSPNMGLPQKEHATCPLPLEMRANGLPKAFDSLELCAP